MDVEKEVVGHRDSSSGHDDVVKLGVRPAGKDLAETTPLPPDPDDGLSDEERRRIVREELTETTVGTKLTYPCRIAVSCSNSTCA